MIHIHVGCADRTYARAHPAGYDVTERILLDSNIYACNFYFITLFDMQYNIPQIADANKWYTLYTSCHTIKYVLGSAQYVKGDCSTENTKVGHTMI